MTATLQRMVRDPRTPSRADGVAGTAARPTDWRGALATRATLNYTNDGKPRPHTEIKIKWQAGGESVLLPDDIDSYDGR